MMEGETQHWSNCLSFLICWTVFFLINFFNNREIAENDDKKRRSAKDVSVYQTESDFFVLYLFAFIAVFFKKFVIVILDHRQT